MTEEPFLVARESSSRRFTKRVLVDDDNKSTPQQEVIKWVTQVVQQKSPEDQCSTLDNLPLFNDDDSCDWPSREYLVTQLLQSMAWEEYNTKESIHKFIQTLTNKVGRWILWHSVFRFLQSTDAIPSSPLLRVILQSLHFLLFTPETCLWNDDECHNVGDPSTFVTQLLVAVPGRVAYACRRHAQGIPQAFVWERFHTGVVETMTICSVVGTTTTWNSFSSWLFRSLLRRHSGEAVARGLWQARVFLLSRVKEMPGTIQEKQQQSRIMSFLQQLDFSDGEAGIYVRAVLRHSLSMDKGESSWPSVACSYWVGRCWEAVCHLIVQSSSSVMGRHAEPHLCHALVALLHQCTIIADDDDDESVDAYCQDESMIADGDKLLWRCVCMVARQWSLATFVRRSDEGLQHHVSCFLLCGVEALSKESVTIDLSTELVTGVSERLKSSTKSIRLDGMRVGMLLAKIQGQDLVFEELIEEEENAGKKNNDKKIEYNISSPDIVEVRLETEDEHQVERYYDLEDDQEDLLNVPKPLYLSECLDLLRTSDNDEHASQKQETALLHIAGLVRSRPIDLCDYAPELARVILRAENKCSDNFHDMVRTSLCSLIVEDPIAVGLNLIAELFEDGTQNDRLTVLCGLHDGAMELSGTTALMDRERNSASPPLISDKVTGKGSFLRKRWDAKFHPPPEQKTTRWGRRKKGDTTRIIESRFREVGPVWFCALTKRFLETREESRLWGYETGSYLLSRMLDTLNCVVYCTGPYAPGVEYMAKDLFELAWTFREAEVPDVRMAVLHSIAAVSGLLGENETISRVLGESPRSLGFHLQDIAQNDPDQECRAMALSLKKTIAEKAASNPLLTVVVASTTG